MTHTSLYKNEYFFNWLIEDFGFHKTLKYFDSKEIRSPVFTTDNFGQASWFLAIQDVTDFASNLTARCSLMRCTEDEGPESVTIQWQVSVTSTESECTSENVTDLSIKHSFTKGYSCAICNLTWNSNAYRPVKHLTIQCQMVGYSSIEIPFLKTSTILTKINEFLWKPKTLLEIKLLSGYKDIQYKMFFHVSEGNISIRICRCDSNNFIKCYMLYGLNVERGVIRNVFHTNGKELLRKHFNLNDIFDVPDVFKINELCNCKFTNSVIINILICTSILVEDAWLIENPLDIKKKRAYKLDSDILEDLRRMYENRIHSDVTLKIGTKFFPAHKCVLASRSSVFAAMFNQDMSEKKTGVVNITDITVDTLNLLLNYIYMNVIDGLNNESALNLLLAAEKYQIFPLKMKCASYLLDNISEENVCEVLAIADMTCYSGLKISAMDYVKVHANKVLRSDNWKQFVKVNPTVAAETLSMISEDLGAALDKNCSFCETSSSSFGTSPAFGGFNATSMTNKPVTSLSKGELSSATLTETTRKFIPLTGTDTVVNGGVSFDIGTKHQCITSMNEYKNKSFEELRFENYSIKSSCSGFNFETTLQTSEVTSAFLFRGSTTVSSSIFRFGEIKST